MTRGGQKEGPAQGNSPENSCSQSRHGLKFPDKKPFPHCSPFGSTIHHKSMLHTHSHTHTVLYAHPHAGQRAPGLRRSLPSAQGLPQSAGTVAGRGERHWVPSTQSQLPVKSWWTRTAPLLPPFLIMTGPRGPKQRGRLSEDGKWERRAGGGRKGGRWNRHLFWGETSTWPDAEWPQGPFPHPQGGEPARVPPPCLPWGPCSGIGESPRSELQ